MFYPKLRVSLNKIKKKKKIRITVKTSSRNIFIVRVFIVRLMNFKFYHNNRNNNNNNNNTDPFGRFYHRASWYIWQVRFDAHQPSKGLPARQPRRTVRNILFNAYNSYGTCTHVTRMWKKNKMKKNCMYINEIKNSKTL